MSNRAKAYTWAGLRRVNCHRFALCGNKARFQWRWRACALHGRYGWRWYAFCKDCDVELNRLTVEFMLVPDAEAVIAAYRAQVEAEE